MTVPVVTIFGGSGFIGRQVAQRMARAGWRVRVAVRRPDQAGFVRPYLERVFPQLAGVPIDYAWGGMVGVTMNRLRVFVASRIAGRGR